jgi:hypothetical protein
MSDKEALLEIEDKICELEFARLKKMHARNSVLVTVPKPEACDSWQLRTTKLENGRTRYQLRSASGEWRNLPEDLTKWPADVRELHEKSELIDKMRSVGGRMLANFGGIKRLS